MLADIGRFTGAPDTVQTLVAPSRLETRPWDIGDIVKLIEEWETVAA